MLDFIKEVVIPIVIIVIVVFSIVFPFAYIAERTSCLSSYSSYNPQYQFWSGCRIEWQGKLTPVDMIKNINVNQ